MPIVTDNFNRANETPIGGNWSSSINAGIKLSSNAVTQNGGAGNNASHYSASTFTNNQYSQAKITTVGSGDAGVTVRASSGGNFYFFSTVNSLARLAKFVSSSYTTIVDITNGGVTSANDILKCSVYLDILKGYINNTVEVSITDASLTSGYPGIFIYETSVIFDDFEGGDYLETSSFLPLGSIGTSQSSTANQSSFTLTTTLSVSVDNLIVLIVACDNNQTTDGDEGAVSSVTDSASNTWTKGAEFTNGQGAAQAGATCSIWWCQLTSELASSSTITVNLTNNTSRDKTCSTAYSFYAPGIVSLEGTPGTLANDSADPGSLNVTTIDTECLRVRGIAAESNTTTVLTPTIGWVNFSGNQTTGGGSAGNMAVRGEFIISNGTSSASDPTLTSADCASVYIALKASGAITKPLFKRRPYQVRI